jgi:4-hydroxy-tetrahydrodipicolinate reductase
MNIIIHGSTGRMGRKLLELLDGSAVHTLAAAVSPEEEVLKTLNDYQGPADLIIDFSFHGAFYDLLDYAEARNLPVVIATTGHTAEEKARIAEAAKVIPVFYSGNMSGGVALLVRLAKLTAQTFPHAEIEIIEILAEQTVLSSSFTGEDIYEWEDM